MKKTEVIYGVHSVKAVMERRGEDILELYISMNRDRGSLASIVQLADELGLKPQDVKSTTLDAMADSPQHQGVAIKCRQTKTYDEGWFWRKVVEERVSAAPPLVVVLEGVTDPHNLGAVFRSADGVAADAVVVAKRNSAHLSPAVHKVSVGASQMVPFVVANDLPEFVRTLSSKGLKTVGLAVGGRSDPLYDLPLQEPCAMVFGAEGRGLSARMLSACDVVGYIPMAGYVDSLNVSVAVGVSLFEVQRQRR